MAQDRYFIPEGEPPRRPLTVEEFDALTRVQQGEPKLTLQWGVAARIRAALADREGRLPFAQDARPADEDPA